MIIRFEINGEAITVDENPSKKLLFFLRENGYTTVKNGCNGGTCSACTVLMNDIPVASCKIPLGLADGNKILTMEGFTKTKEYQDIEKGFKQARVLTCGFCISGKVFTAHRIITLNPRPTKEEIRDKISLTDCSCTEIETLTNGIYYAAAARENRLNESKKGVKNV